MRNEIIISVSARNERKTALVAADDAFYKTAVFGTVKSAVDVDDNAVVFKPTQNILYRATLKRRFRAVSAKMVFLPIPVHSPEVNLSDINSYAFIIPFKKISGRDFRARKKAYLSVGNTENYNAESNHCDSHYRNCDDRKFSQLMFHSFTFIFTVESFLLTAERAYAVGIAGLHHDDYYNEQRAKNRNDKQRNANLGRRIE